MVVPRFLIFFCLHIPALTQGWAWVLELHSGYWCKTNQEKAHTPTPRFSFSFSRGLGQGMLANRRVWRKSFLFSFYHFCPEARCTHKVALLPQLWHGHLKSGKKTHVLIQRNRTNEAKWFEKLRASVFLFLSLSFLSSPCPVAPSPGQHWWTELYNSTRASTERNTGLFNQRNSKTDPSESESIWENPLRNEVEKGIL